MFDVLVLVETDSLSVTSGLPYFSTLDSLIFKFQTSSHKILKFDYWRNIIIHWLQKENWHSHHRNQNEMWWHIWSYVYCSYVGVLQLFVGGFMSHLRYFFMFAYSGVQHTVLCFCFLCLRLVYRMLPVSLDCSFLLPLQYSLAFIYYQYHKIQKTSYFKKKHKKPPFSTLSNILPFSLIHSMPC